MSVRRAAAAEAPAIARIRIATWRHAYSGQMPAQILDDLDETRATEFFRSVIETGANENRLLSGYCSAELCGFALWNRHSEEPAHTAEIRALYVLPANQRSGLGRALFERCRQEMSAAGFRSLTVFTLETNHPARRFYEEMGGRPLPYRRTFTVAEAALPEIGYEVPLRNE